MKFITVTVYVTAVYDFGEGDEGEMVTLWSDLDSILDIEGSGYRLCVTGELNEWVGDGVRERII